MGFQNREREVKLSVRKSGGRKAGPSLVECVVGNTLGKDETGWVQGYGTDVYFRLPSQNKAKGMARIRKTSDGRCQMTVKVQDRGDSTDRVEVDLEVKDPRQAIKLLRALLGEDEVGSITKEYRVHFLGDEHTTVSVYNVDGDDRVFVEVEAKTLPAMRLLEKRVVEGMRKAGLESERVPMSLYDLFLNGGEDGEK